MVVYHGDSSSHHHDHEGSSFVWPFDGKSQVAKCAKCYFGCKPLDYAVIKKYCKAQYPGKDEKAKQNTCKETTFKSVAKHELKRLDIAKQVCKIECGNLLTSGVTGVTALALIGSQKNRLSNFL